MGNRGCSSPRGVAAEAALRPFCRRCPRRWVHITAGLGAPPAAFLAGLEKVRGCGASRAAFLTVGGEAVGPGSGARSGMPRGTLGVWLQTPDGAWVGAVGPGSGLEVGIWKQTPRRHCRAKRVRLAAV